MKRFSEEQKLGLAGFVVMLGIAAARFHFSDPEYLDPLLDWSLVFVTIALIGALVLVRLPEKGSRRIYSRNFCKVCGYSRKGNTSGVCPECGTSF